MKPRVDLQLQPAQPEPRRRELKGVPLAPRRARVVTPATETAIATNTQMARGTRV